MEKIITTSKKTPKHCCSAMMLIALLFINFSVQAQYESFFGRETWEYSTATRPITKEYNPNLIGCVTNTYHFSSSDTMIINGKKYYNGSLGGHWPHPVKLYEDTLYGRLYALIEDNDYLICDMSMEVGDTFKLPIPLNSSNDYVDTMWMIADSITFANSKKVIHLSPVSVADEWFWCFFDFAGSYNITLRFMEGIGAMYGIIPPRINWTTEEVLLCLAKDDTICYMTHPDLGCWQDYVSISDYLEQSITISPNPANNQISVLFETDEDIMGDIIIRDITGRVCLQTSVSCSTTNINIESLSNGIYLLTYKDNHNKITKKFVKQ